MWQADSIYVRPRRCAAAAVVKMGARQSAEGFHLFPSSQPGRASPGLAPRSGDAFGELSRDPSREGVHPFRNFAAAARVPFSLAPPLWRFEWSRPFNVAMREEIGCPPFGPRSNPLWQMRYFFVKNTTEEEESTQHTRKKTSA
jgi:hypothetical protein